MRNTIRFDWAIKRLLRNKANFGILEGFLSELLGDDIKIQSLLESEGNQESRDNKYNRVDMLVSNAKNELIIIECQTTRVQDYLMRMLFGVSKLIVDHLDLGLNYNEIKKVISINIVYFDLGHGDDYIYKGTTDFVGLNKGDKLSLSLREQAIYHTDEINKIYPEYYIIKVENFDDIAVSGIQEWLYLLKNGTIKSEFSAKGIKEASDRLQIMNLSETERAEYEKYMLDQRYENSLTVGNYLAGKEEGKAEGIAEGIAEGEANKELYAIEKVKQEKIDMALKCLKKGMNAADIADITGLTESEVNEIRGMK